MKTYTTKSADITRSWRVVDAEGATLGRLATEVAAMLRGKHKPTFSPHLDTGDPVIVVNGKPLDEFFARDGATEQALLPFSVTNTGRRFNAMVKVEGGGVSGQIGAIAHGIARALLQVDKEHQGALRRAGLLTRDPRAKERKKPGLKRARKAPQFTKR